MHCLLYIQITQVFIDKELYNNETETEAVMNSNYSYDKLEEAYHLIKDKVKDKKYEELIEANAKMVMFKKTIVVGIIICYSE